MLSPSFLHLLSATGITFILRLLKKYDGKEKILELSVNFCTLIVLLLIMKDNGEKITTTKKDENKNVIKSARA